MTMMSDLSQDLLEHILSRVPITSLGAVRSTCKRWNTLSKDRILCKAESKQQQFLGIMIKNFKVCSVRFNLQYGTLNEDVVDPSIKEIGNLLNQVEISNFFHCDGLLLCIPRDTTSRLVVWNPYLGQTRWIEPNNHYHHKFDKCALGYDNNKNRNHKILRMHNHHDYRKKYEIYDFKSSLWRVLDVTPHRAILHPEQFVSVKGNTYFDAIGIKMREEATEVEDFLICFDFTSEKFGPRLPLPSPYVVGGGKVLYSVKEEQLALLYRPLFTSEMEIWVTTKIEPNAVSWSKFFKVDISDFQFNVLSRFFFIDLEKKLAVVYYSNEVTDINTPKCIIAYIIGENGSYMRKVGIGNAVKLKDFPHSRPHMCSYVPSLVQINQIGGRKRKQRKEGS